MGHSENNLIPFLVAYQDFTRDDIDPAAAVGFANDGSFAEFAQGVIEQRKV